MTSGCYLISVLKIFLKSFSHWSHLLYFKFLAKSMLSDFLCICLDDSKLTVFYTTIKKNVTFHLLLISRLHHMILGNHLLLGNDYVLGHNTWSCAAFCVSRVPILSPYKGDDTWILSQPGWPVCCGVDPKADTGKKTKYNKKRAVYLGWW